MAQVFHRYLGKDGKIPEPPKPTEKQEEREVPMRSFRRPRQGSARLSRLSGRAELAQKRGKPVEAARGATRAGAGHLHGDPLPAAPAADPLARRCVGKSQHEMRMIIDSAQGGPDGAERLQVCQHSQPPQEEGCCSDGDRRKSWSRSWTRDRSEDDDDLSWWG